jgi:hypothetical protein
MSVGAVRKQGGGSAEGSGGAGVRESKEGIVAVIVGPEFICKYKSSTAARELFVVPVLLFSVLLAMGG